MFFRTFRGDVYVNVAQSIMQWWSFSLFHIVALILHWMGAFCHLTSSIHSGPSFRTFPSKKNWLPKFECITNGILAHVVPQKLFVKGIRDMTESQIELQSDVLDLVVQPEIKEFLVTMVQMIPKITNIMKITSEMYDLAEELLRDTEMLEILGEAMEGTTQPLQDTIKDGASLVHEAQERAEADTSNVGMIGLYRMLKDPTIQKNLRFMKALLAVIAERRDRELH